MQTADSHANRSCAATYRVFSAVSVLHWAGRLPVIKLPSSSLQRGRLPVSWQLLAKLWQER
jgi:hypothetical protein